MDNFKSLRYEAKACSNWARLCPTISFRFSGNLNLKFITSEKKGILLEIQSNETYKKQIKKTKTQIHLHNYTELVHTSTLVNMTRMFDKLYYISRKEEGKIRKSICKTMLINR